MKKAIYEELISMSPEEQWAYIEKHWDEFHPEVSREHWDLYCTVHDEVHARAKDDLRKEWNIKNDDWPLGSCHFIWDRMQQIFKEEYNIDWKSPAECAPDVCFD
jgi:hypothetical protein